MFSKNIPNGFFVLSLILILSSVNAFAQTDSSKVKSQASIQKEKTGEMVLDAILIQGVVEKPNVAILPTREKPDFGETEFFNKTFEKELKYLPPRVFLFDSNFDKIEHKERIKQILKKKFKVK